MSKEVAARGEERPTKPPQDSNPLDLGPVEAAVNEAAKRANATWIAFLTLNVYIFIATFTITPLRLLKGLPVHLPIFNADLPVEVYFCIAPFLTVAAYFYLTVQLQGLAEKVGAYERLLSTQRRIRVDREWMRRRLDSSIFVRIFSESHEHWPSSVTRITFRAVGIGSVVLGPIALLTVAQLVHLPNQNEMVNNTVRLLLVVTVAIAAWFWFGVLRPRSFSTNILFGALFFASCFSSLFVAVFPGETLYHRGHLQWIQERFTAPILESAPDRVTLGTRFPFSNRLVILQEVVGATNKVEVTPETVSLRGRSLRNAVFDGTIFRNTDFTGADLVGASMRGAVFEADIFGCADFRCTNLSGADLENAGLKEADLSRITAYGINLKGAMLLGATLNSAKLQGASLEKAHLEGSDLSGTGLQGANLEGARLVAATLWGTELQGANLRFASLQASTLSGALLQDAALDFAKIEGADLRTAGLKNASLRCVKPYRTRLNPVELQTAAIQPCPASYSSWVDSITYDEPSPYSRKDDTTSDLGYSFYESDPIGCAEDFLDRQLRTSDGFTRFLDQCTKNFARNDMRELIRSRFEILLPSAKAPDEEAQNQSSWQKLEGEADRSAELSKRRLDRLKEIACVGIGAPFVARGILRGSSQVLSNDARHELIAELKAATRAPTLTCPGVRELALSEFDEVPSPQ